MNIQGINLIGCIITNAPPTQKFLINYVSTSLSPVSASAFGYSLASTDSMVSVGAYRYNSLVGEVIVYNSSNDALTINTTIPSPSTTKMWFGYDVAMNSEWIAISAPYNTSDGAIYLYKINSDGTFPTTPTQTILGTDVNQESMVGTLFGYSLCMCNNLLVVGYPGYDPNYGGVMVFSLSDDVWTEVSFDNTFTNSVKYGFSVCTNGEYIIVGGISSTSSSSVGNGGCAILKYDSTNNEVNLIKEFRENGDDGTSNNNFGYSVDISSGDIILIGSPKSNTYGMSYVYDTSGNLIQSISIGTENCTIDDSSITTSAEFGSNVKIYTDNVLLISASGYGTNIGAVYVLEYTNDSWTPSTNITNSRIDPDSTTYTGFGQDITYNSDNIFIGSYIYGAVSIYN